MDEFPRSAIARVMRVTRVVVSKALVKRVSLPDVVSASGFTFQNVDIEDHEVPLGKIKVGGADGIRTHGLLDAIEARSQLRHGPTDLQHYIDVRCCS
jgi:hypothetical protein